ncbi:MAG: hypothetical protein QXX76_07750 [Archaeoglobaceae archaeon]|uniref:Uncharacterized protein n=1 Tax=Archaeoglobus fulgidus TaxID=2234 RepID=A0A7J3M494_ARCFL
MITYKIILDLLKKEIGPAAKLFLDKAMNTLGITEINEKNYKEVLELLKMNRELREYIIEVERKLESMK